MLNIYISMVETPEEKSKIEKFYNENYNFLLNYANKILKNKTKAEDAVHEAFISIIKNGEKYLKLNGSELRPLSVVIVRSKCIDIIRKEEKIIDITTEDLEKYLESKEKSHEETMEYEEEYEKLKKYLKEIDLESSQILIMKYAENMTMKEIGKFLNLSPKHIETKIYRAKIKLRKLMEGEEDEKNR